jgi:hypothetical protein
LIRRIQAIFILILLVTIIGFAGYIYFTRFSSYPEAQATLHVTSGAATITRTGSAPVDLNADQDHAVKAGDTVNVKGWATLALAGVQVDIMPGTELDLKLASALGNEGQSDVILKTGQVFQRVSGYTSSRSYYSVSAGGATLKTLGGEILVRALADGTTEFANGAGSAAIKVGSKNIALNENQGISVKAGEVVPDPIAWSEVSIHTYQPNGSAVTLPVTLVNQQNKSEYNFTSDMSYLVPEGLYTLRLQTLSMYELKDINLSAKTSNDLPITLGEVLFAITDAKGNPKPFTALTVKGAEQARALPDAPVLIGPGRSNLMVAREEKADAVQPVEITVAPGQQITATLRDDLFGGGKVQVDFGTSIASPSTAVSAMVFPPDGENGDPIATFKTDSASPLLAPGDYILSVRTQLAGRYLVTVPQNQTVTVSVPLGYLDVTYTDAQGKPVNRNAFLYVASATEMTRLSLPMDQMRRTPYGLSVPIEATNHILLPAGTYNVMIDDRKDVSAQNIEVQAGQVNPLQLQVAP